MREWGRQELHLLIALYIRYRFPIIVALNKMDLLPSSRSAKDEGKAEENDANALEAALQKRYPGEQCIPMSAGVEWDLLQLRKRHVVRYVSGGTSFDVLPLQEWETKRVGSSAEGLLPCDHAGEDAAQENLSRERPTTTTLRPRTSTNGRTGKEEFHASSPSQRSGTPMAMEMEEANVKAEETRQGFQKRLQRAIRFFRGEKTEDRPRLPSEVGPTHEKEAREKKKQKTGGLTASSAASSSSSSASMITISSNHAQPITTGVQCVLAAALAAFPTTVILPVVEDWRSFFSSSAAPITITTSTAGETTTSSTTPSWNLPHTLCYRYGTVVETVFTSMTHMGLADGKLVRFEVLPVRALERFFQTHSSSSSSSASSSSSPSTWASPPSPVSSESIVENSGGGVARLPSMHIPEEQLRKLITPWRRTEVLPSGVLLVRVLTNKFQRHVAGKKTNEA